MKLKIMRKEIENSLNVLRAGGILIYPTDTIWGIGCDATSEKAVSEIYRIKRRSESKSLVILVSDWEMLSAYVPEIPDGVKDYLRQVAKPTTVIYQSPTGLAPNVVASDNTVAIRLVRHDFCRDLIREFGRPLVSTSANFSGVAPPMCFEDIDKELLTKADYIVNLSRKEIQKSASQIVKFDRNGQISYIRK
jgi:L-threonylcarbamoyladenylate synthase